MGSDSVGVTTASYGALALLLLLVLVVLWRSGFMHRLLANAEEMLFSNWQLATLGATAVALSLASGYTTFDGLRNFTSSPLLSVLVAFGIQGVMLIVAWLIGESFATGMSYIPSGKSLSARETAIGAGLGLALGGLIFCWVLIRYEIVGFARGAGGIPAFRADWQRFTDVALYFAMALVLVALVAFSFRRGGDVARPYVQSARLIAKNAVLWVMLLAAMSASVFFSFDSHFNGIFPAEARARAAEIRTLNQIAGIVADIGERARKAQAAEAERLFASEGWKAYDAQIARLASAVRDTQAEMEAVLVRHMEERQRGIGEQQERVAGAERSRAALLRKRDELEAELQRIEPSIGALESELAKAQAGYDAGRQAMAAKRIDAAAEDGGVEGTLKAGKGPAWRQRMGELDELQRRLALVEEPRLKEAQRQRDLASARIVGLKREIATVVGEVAKYKGQIATAEHRIKAAEADAGSARGGGLEPGRALTELERTRATFRRRPEAEALAALQTLCGTLVGALSATPAAQERTRGIDCDPKSAAEAAARVFALNAGLAVFQERCAGGSRLPQKASTDELLAFGRKCLQDSGLASQEAAGLGARLQAIEMNRDDKAHRFVVTWNAFLDGNRLAYLALALAIGIDALVFTAGLFGAAAARSPLSDLPSPKARSAEQLEAVIRNALGEDHRRNAELALAAMKPVHGDAGHRAEVELVGYEAQTVRRIRQVLVAGASIGAVERAPSDSRDERYLVRPELFEYLSLVANTARASDRQESNRSRLVQIVGVALGPNRQSNAEIVLRHIEPIDHRRDFMAKVELGAVPEYERRLVQTVLNAGMTMSAVQRSRGSPGTGILARALGRPAPVSAVFLVHSDLFKALLLHRAGGIAPDDADDDRPAAIRPVRTPLGRPSPPRADHLLIEGRRGNAGNDGLHGTDQTLADSIRYDLILAMGLTTAAADQVWRMEIAAAAILSRWPDLSDQWRLAESDLRHALEQELDAVAARFADDAPTLAALSEQAAEIERRIPALLLVREAGLIERLLQRLEEARSKRSLRDGDRPLMSQLRKLAKASPTPANAPPDTTGGGNPP